jgi:lipopolysaccharide heptosyltransferase II
VSGSPWLDARRVLAVRLDGMGDLLMTSPAIRAVKTAGCRVSVLVSPAGEEAARLIPGIDEVIVYEAPWVKASPTPSSGTGERLMIERLRRGCFDAAVVFTVYSQSPLPAALLCQMADIPLRLAHCRENPYHLLSDWIPEPDPGHPVRHEVRRQLDLVAAVGYAGQDEWLRVRVPPESQERVADVLAAGGGTGAGPLVVVHTGASAPSRRYPAEHFTEAARLLARQGCCLAFTGSAAELDTVESIRARLGAPSLCLAGRLDLAGLAALLSFADVLVTNNSGPVHLAAAVGTPVVDLYALTNPQHTPWGVGNRVLFHDVECRWCYKSACPEGHHNCLRLVPPALVAEAALDLLECPPEPLAAALAHGGPA